MKDKPTSERVPRRNPPLRRSIGIKLTIAFLALAIIPMSATAYYNLARSQNEVAEVARESLMELSRGAARNIGQLLTENQRTSATLAGEPLAVQFLAASEEEREALSPQVYQMLQNFADTHPDYDAPGLLDTNGIVLASLAEVLVGKDRSFRDYFQASIQGQPYVSSMLVGRATGRPGVFLTNPVVTAEGEIVGIDIVWLKGDTVWSIIDDVVAGEEGIAYLVDQDGVIIAHPDRDLLYHSLGQLTPEAAATISATIRFGTVEDTDAPLIPQSLGLDDLAAELASQGSGDYRYTSPLDDRDHVVGYTRLEAYPWTVVVDVPEAQFLAPLRRLGRVTWGSVGVVAAITLIVSILLQRTITRPLHRLTEAASALERGQPFEPADIADVTSGRDEIAHLGRVFSNMVLALRRREERIVHLNLVLRAIRNVNQLISREKDRDRLLKSACDTLIETRGYHNAWIALLDESGDLITTAEAGLGEVFLPLVEQLKRGELTDCGRRALKQSDVVITQDLLSTCADCPLSAGCGAKEAMTVRLEHGEKVYGLMSVSIPVDFTTDEEEEFLFAEVAGDIAFALHSIDLEEERKQAEAALQEYSERLEEMVEERTKDLREAQEQLVRREKLAVLGQLAGGVGHELRNPLGVISNAVYFLKMALSDPDETTREYLDMISSEVRDSTKIISDLLDFSRTRQPEREEIAVSDLVAQVLAKRPPPEDVEVTTQIPADLPPVFVDPRQIVDQVLGNLVTNGYQAMPDGGGLTITAEFVEGGDVRNPKSKICIGVSDSGCGIPEENMEKIFEPLFTTKAKGIGLGLALVKTLVEANGGSIEAESEAGKGSTFTVRLQST